jgi:hypothetical protein
MSFSTPIRSGLTILCLAASPLLAQAIPATPPTKPSPLVPIPASQTPAQPIAAQPVRPPSAASLPAHRAQVTFTGGRLSIIADNSSLNQILREISTLTGMKITGGVNDERVYGTYGPGDASTILASLLGGTGSNMLLIFDSHRQPQELILTSRNGGPTPPSPSASRGRDEDDLPPQLTPHIPRGATAQLPPRPQTPGPPAAEPTPAAADPAANTTTQQSPNGVSTPQQIYDQLMKLKQQQSTQPGAPPANPPQ